MSSLDTWNPSDLELDEPVEPELVRRNARIHMDEVRHKEAFLDRQKDNTKVAEGLCGYCERQSSREFCGSACERSAAFTSIGGALKFHNHETEK